MCKHWQCPAGRKMELRVCGNPILNNSRDCGREREPSAEHGKRGVQLQPRGCTSPTSPRDIFPFCPVFGQGRRFWRGHGGHSDAGTRQRWHSHHHQCVRRLPAPAVIHNTFLSVEARPFQPALENTSSRPGTHRGASPGRAEPVSQPSEIGCEEEREEEEEEFSRNPPPPGRCSASLGREETGGGFPPVFCGVGSYREGCAGGGVFPFSPHPGRARRWKRKKKAGGRKKWKNKLKEVRGLAAPRPEHQKPGPIPGDCAVGGASPGSAG